jgi:hypothetical protein
MIAGENGRVRRDSILQRHVCRLFWNYSSGVHDLQENTDRFVQNFNQSAW